jgi:hypothetical protein
MKEKITDKQRQKEGVEAGFLNCKAAHRLHVPCNRCEMCKGYGPAHALTHQDKDLFYALMGETKAEYRQSRKVQEYEATLYSIIHCREWNEQALHGLVNMTENQFIERFDICKAKFNMLMDVKQ